MEGQELEGQERTAYVRESMRRSWAARVRAYTEEAAPNTAAHTAALLDIVPARPGERVLDVATGPGVVAVAAARRVGPAGQVVATDLAPEWGAVVAERAAAAGVANVAFRTMDAGALDLPDDAFDVAYCQFGLMFVPHPVQALRELRRVLRAGGRLGVVVWSTPDRVPCISILTRHLSAVVPPEPPERELPSPLALGEAGLLERHVEAAGFRCVRAERRTLDFVFASPAQLWRLRVDEGPPAVRAAVGALAPEARERLRGAVDADLAPYVRQGAVRLPSEAIYVAAVKYRPGRPAGHKLRKAPCAARCEYAPAEREPTDDAERRWDTVMRCPSRGGAGAGPSACARPRRHLPTP